jgi:uncharacterized membrane protein YgdD (TMEM256/DUF423 family)
MSTLTIRLTALSGFLAVLLGALGAHALKARLAARDATTAWQTAAHYHLAHSLACLALIAWAAAQPERTGRLQRITTLWLIGNLLFAGSIYGLALGGPRLLGPITPLGGLAFLAGWLLLGLESAKKPRA